MSEQLDLIARNEKYAANFAPEEPNFKNVVVVCCMDQRINPYSQLGLEHGEAHILRNAGGSAKDALRSIIVSQHLIATREVAVCHHTDCGGLRFTTSEIRETVKKYDPGNADLAKQVDAINFLEFSDVEQSVKDDVKFLRESYFLAKGTKITGWVYDVASGKVTKVA